MTASEEWRVSPGEAATLDARLTTALGQPITGADLVLFAGDLFRLQAHTSTDGSTIFRLPADLREGDYPLSVIFAGNEQLEPAMADVTLHYHTAAPSSSEDASVTSITVPTPAAAPVPLSAPLPAQLAVASTQRRVAIQQTAANPVAPTNSTSPGLANMLIEKIAPLVAPMGPPVTALAMLARNAYDAVSAWTDLATAAVLRSFPQLQPTGRSGVLLMTALLVVLGLVFTPTMARRRFTVPRVGLPGLLTQWRRVELPQPLWYGIRILSVGITLGLTVILVVRPAQGLFIFWRVFIPIVPLLFFLAPGLWRNICPMAALNQTPRLFNFSRALTLPKWLQRYGFLVAISLFLVIVSSRKVLFNYNGPALAILILGALGSAFIMGNFFKGKSGWCSSICPLLPVQRIYGQTPFVAFSHAHCAPCLGCTKNCYDLSPNNAYLADLYDDDRQFAGMRKAFAGFFPGFVLAFYLVPNPPEIAIWQVYAMLIAAGAVSLATFLSVEAALHVTSNKITVIYGAAALNFYYWFNSLTLGSLIDSTPPSWFVWSLRTFVFGLTLIWIYRTYRKESTYIELTLAPSTGHSIALEMPGLRTIPNKPGANQGTERAAPSSEPVITVQPEGTQFTVAKNRTLLESIESQGLPIESGCRMGLCGADPVCVMAGMDNLSKAGAEECKTLERLGLAPNTRLACMARVRGAVTVALTPEKPEVYRSSIVTGFRHDVSIKRVVIVGNGIAGVTAADHIRRRHPHCEIHLIGREPHHLYNRMGITRLIYGRSAMQGLYLLPDQWYDDFNITCWLNTKVTQIDAEQRQVVLGMGEKLDYDRLIFATGSRSFVPSIKRFGMPGTFVLRSAEDAIAMRAYVQEQASGTAVVAGGGLLGLEAAYGLSKMGLKVTVVERGRALLSRQLDARSAEFLAAFLSSIGINLVMEAEVAAVNSENSDSQQIEGVALKDGRVLPCDLLLVSAGIRSDVSLAHSCGLEIKRGVVVDAQMRTSDPYIFAAGDVAEFEEKVSGLWSVAVSQAEVAAANAVAEAGVVGATYVETPPATILKVAGIDVTSIGRIQPLAHEDEIVLEESVERRYRKLILDGGMIVGAILLGYSEEAAGVSEAARQRLDMTPHLAALKSGDWQSLRALA